MCLNRAGVRSTSATSEKYAALKAYNLKCRGLKSFEAAPMDGKSNPTGITALYRSLCHTFHGQRAEEPAWKGSLPTRSQLRRTGFGRPSTMHSFTQEAAFETCLHPLLLSGYLDFCSFAALCEITPVIPHIATMVVRLYNYDFTWITYEDPNWKNQLTVPQSNARAMLAALFHYRMHAADVMRFLENTYTGEYRDINGVIETLTSHNIDPVLIAHYVRTTTVGCPAHFVAESSRAKAMIHWQEGNHSSIKKYLVQMLNTMAKEHRNRFNIPLPSYIAWYLPHLFLTPQHVLDKPGKALRLIFDATKRYTPTSTPINMMTSTHLGVELDCEYGDVLQSTYDRIWDERIDYPDTDIVTHANDVKSCFKQMKLHPDVMAAFSLIVTDFLYLQTALPFGTDFSPQNWEPCRCLIEILAVKLFDDDTLRDKHRKYLDQLRWDPSLGNYKGPFTPAKACSQRRGVKDSRGNDVPMPQRLFVDDAVYSDVYQPDRKRIERTIAASIEAIFILLGCSDLSKRQDPISFDKLVSMKISHINKILGQIINTRTLDVGVPDAYRARTINLLQSFH
ncbi:hypothetical protein ACHAWF_006478, partial [Thalassiosira exigua]